MQNITLLSLAIAGSFQRSPFLQISSSTSTCFSIMKNINSQYFFSSFLFTQTFKSFSTVENSIFNHFITSQPVLAFATDQNIKKNYYGDSIPKDSSPFYITNFTIIQGCKFMSITDNTQEQLLPDVGLCIYSTKNTTVDSCYFFAIQSYRSGSAILFDTVNNILSNTTVTNCIFKSISQTLIDFGNQFLTGGAVSHGRSVVEQSSMSPIFVRNSKTDNCCFEKVRLIGTIFNGRQFGILSYISNNIESTNLNFTDNEMGGDSQKYGEIFVYLQQEHVNKISYVNIFDSEYTNYGAFSIILNAQSSQRLQFSFANFINNSAIDDQKYPSVGIEIQSSNDTSLHFSDIKCNTENSFYGASISANAQYNQVKLNIEKSVFRIPQSSLSLGDSDTNKGVQCNLLDGNSYDQGEFNLEVTNDLISDFGYIQTSHFSPSDSFSNRFIQDSASYYDLSQDSPITAGVLATIFGIISFIVFIFLLCVRKGGKKREYEVIGKFDSKDQFDNSEGENTDGDNNDNEDGVNLEDIPEDKKPRSSKKKRGRKSTSIVETNDSNDSGTHDPFGDEVGNHPRELDEKVDPNNFDF